MQGSEIMMIPEREHGLLASAMHIAAEQWRKDADTVGAAGDDTLRVEFQRYALWADSVVDECE
jgi:hypothetical protein